MSSPLHRFVAKVVVAENEDPCWLWDGAVGSDDYGKFRSGNSMSSAHRYAYELFKGPIPEDLCVLHRCDTPLCVNPTHLFLGTKADNSADMMRKERHQHSARKLSREQVRDLKRQLRDGVPKTELARRFDICRSTVQDIASGDAWKDDDVAAGQGLLFPATS